MPECSTDGRTRLFRQAAPPRADEGGRLLPFSGGPATPPTRTFLGVQEIAGIVNDLATLLTDNGHEVEGVVFRNRYHAAAHPSLRQISAPGWLKSPRLRMLWQRLALLFLFPAILFRNRTFVFVWSITFLPANLDLVLLWLLGRKVVVFNCGDDARYRPIHDRLDCEILQYDWLGNDPEGRAQYLKTGNSFLKTLWFQKIQEWTGAQIVSSRNLATFQAVPCAHFRFPQQRLVAAPRTTRATPLIVHAPSSRNEKGTKYVLGAIDRLRAEGLSFDFRLIENMPNSQVLAALREADIVVDQAWGGWPGRFGFEALAAGCVLVGGYRPDYCGYPERLPIVPFEPDADRLAQALARLVVDSNERQRLMNASYECWRKHSSPEATYAWYRRLIDGKAETFAPLADHKGHLLRFAPKRWQRALIRWLH
jgi:hypothetical protein